MSDSILFLHNLLRWVVLALGLFTLFRSATGLLANGGWLANDERARKFFPMSLEIAFVVGLLLWVFFSPITQQGFQAPAAAMKDPTIRFFFVEHGLSALLAVGLARVGSIRAKRLKNARAKFQSMLVFHGLALVVLGARIPWDRPFIHLPG